MFGGIAKAFGGGRIQGNKPGTTPPPQGLMGKLQGLGQQQQAPPPMQLEAQQQQPQQMQQPQGFKTNLMGLGQPPQGAAMGGVQPQRPPMGAMNRIMGQMQQQPQQQQAPPEQQFGQQLAQQQAPPEMQGRNAAVMPNAMRPRNRFF